MCASETGSSQALFLSALGDTPDKTTNASVEPRKLKTAKELKLYALTHPTVHHLLSHSF